MLLLNLFLRNKKNKQSYNHNMIKYNNSKDDFRINPILYSKIIESKNFYEEKYNLIKMNYQFNDINGRTYHILEIKKHICFSGINCYPIFSFVVCQDIHLNNNIKPKFNIYSSEFNPDKIELNNIDIKYTSVADRPFMLGRKVNIWAVQ